MGKKKKNATEGKKSKDFLKKLERKALQKRIPEKCKTKCCEKYEKSELKRCGRCPCYDLLQRVA